MRPWIFSDEEIRALLVAGINTIPAMVDHSYPGLDSIDRYSFKRSLYAKMSRLKRQGYVAVKGIDNDGKGHIMNIWMWIA